MAGGDLLHVLADEHRDLGLVTRRLRQGRPDVARHGILRTAARIAEHELAHRLLVHPLLRRDRYGQQVFGERREEQLLLADRLRRTLLAIGEEDVMLDLTTDPPGPPIVRWARSATPAQDPVAGLDLLFVEHTDREEIVDFPHVRHLNSRDELLALVRPRHELRQVLLARLERDPALLVDGRWASTPRRELAALLSLPEDLVAVVPDLAPPRSPAAH